MAKAFKIHLHDEQFDGHLHAVCARVPFDPAPPDPRIVGCEEFSTLPQEERCSRCSIYWWPLGGAPENGEGQMFKTFSTHANAVKAIKDAGLSGIPHEIRSKIDIGGKKRYEPVFMPALVDTITELKAHGWSVEVVSA